MTLLEHLEATFVKTLAAGAGLLPPAAASTMCGGVAGLVGPLLPVSRVAHANLRAALPGLDEAGRRRVVRQAWTQLGRTAGELPHVSRLQHTTEAGPGWQVEGEAVLAALAAQGGPAIFFSGHLGNWEVLPHAARAYGLPVAGIYRTAQNTGVDALLNRLRRSSSGEEQQMFPKGARGARQAMAHLRHGGKLAMLVDQKLNEGVEASFFGLPAMTASAAAAFALHFRCPLVPARARRTGPARLTLVVEEPLVLPDTPSRAADVLALSQQVNDVLERWIREDPGSWLWMHRRWPKPPERRAPGAA